jgi:deazaflavin-dependent oxidoreductase (nitroreductase family)
VRDITAKRLSKLHTSLYRATGGRVGKRLVDNDMLLLTTTGRVSGQRHTVPLLYLKDGRDLIVIASWGGRDDHPEWYLNLLADPSLEIELPGRRTAVVAETVAGDERASWWDQAVAAYDGYAEYQSRTQRQIPIVRLRPVDAPPERHGSLPAGDR